METKSAVFRSRLVAALAMVLGIGVSAAGCRPFQPDPAIQQQIESELQRLLAQGVRMLRRGRIDEAEAVFRLAADLRPADPRLLDGFGCVFLRRGDLEGARAMFQRAIAADRRYSRPYAHLASVAAAEGDLQAANELLVAALTLNPLNYRARRSYGQLLTQIDPPRAHRELLKAYAGRSGIEGSAAD